MYGTKKKVGSSLRIGMVSFPPLMSLHIYGRNRGDNVECLRFYSKINNLVNNNKIKIAVIN